MKPLLKWRHIESVRQKFRSVLLSPLEDLSPEGFLAAGMALLLKDMEDIHKSQNIGIAAIIVRDGKVLLGKRSTGDPSLLECWCHPGGKVEWGETLLQAFSRECLEEIKVQVNRYTDFVSVQERIHEQRHTVMVFYRGRLKDGEEPVIGDGFSDLKWFTMEEIKSMIEESVSDRITPMSGAAMKEFFEL